MASLYFVKSYSPYYATPGGISGAFVLAESKAEAVKAFKDPGRKITEARPATQRDIDQYSNGRSREEIIENLTAAAKLSKGR